MQFRAGGRVLSLFSTTLHGLILRSLANGPVGLAELHRRAGEPSQKALRGNIGNLIGIGALEKRKPDGDPELLDNGLTQLGRKLLFVADALDAWLMRAPQGPLNLESEGAKEAIKAFVGGWCSTMLRALAVRDLSLAELDELIASFGYRALERRVAAMHRVNMLTAIGQDGAGSTFAATAWLREAVAPLLAAVRCERLYLQAETAPLTRIDVETALLLAVPLLGPVGAPDGTCQIAVDLSDGANSGPAGLRVAMENGGIVSCVSKLDREPSDWASGPAAAWLEAIVHGDASELRAGGGDGLSTALLASLHDRLFGELDHSD